MEASAKKQFGTSLVLALVAPLCTTGLVELTSRLARVRK